MITKIVRGSFVSLITAPVALVILHVLAYLLNWSNFGIYLTLYHGIDIHIYRIIKWLMLMDPKALELHNFLTVITAWCVAWYISADWVKDPKANFLAPIFDFIVIILYFAAWAHSSIILYFPESFILFFSAWLMATIIIIKDKYRKKEDFFDRLIRTGIKVTDKDRSPVEIPVICSNCGTKIYSKADYCWKCGNEILKYR